MPQVFISYARDDGVGEQLAANVREKLEHAGIIVFHDIKSIDVGDTWLNELNSALASCQAMVLIISKKACASSWVQNEFSVAQERGILIIPILSEKISLPLWVRHLQVLDFSQNESWRILINKVEKHLNHESSDVEDSKSIANNGVLLGFLTKVVRAKNKVAWGLVFAAISAFFAVTGPLPSLFNKPSNGVAVIKTEEEYEGIAKVEITGYVLDRVLESGIYKVNVELFDTSLSSTTDETGFFSIVGEAVLSKKMLVLKLPNGKVITEKLDRIKILDKKIYVEWP